MNQLFIGFALGVLAEAVVSVIIRCIFWGSGTLKIDRTNPAKPVLRFIIDEGIETVGKKTRYLLRIDNDADLSQK